MDSLKDRTWESGFADGRRHGLAIAALLISLVSFVSLLGAEKAIASITLGALALQGATAGTVPRRMGIAAICIASVFLITIAVVLIVFWDKLIEFVRLFEQLS
jgi:hypothetical protein